MSFKLYCKRCDSNYWTCGSSTWYKSGTVTRCPSYGYCGSCAGETSYSYSPTGNHVKVECRGCSNLITVITWYKWKNKSHEDVGYCNGCHDNWVNKKSSMNSIQSSASSHSWASVGWDGWSGYSGLCNANFKIHCKSSYHYVYCGSKHHVVKWILNKSSCPVCDDYNWYPENAGFSNPSWGKIQYSVDDWRRITSCTIKCNKYNHSVYNGTIFSTIKSTLALKHCRQCEQRHDWCPSNSAPNFPSWSRNLHNIQDNFWAKCEIYCNSVSHVIYVGTTHSQILSKCSLSQCPDCKIEKDRVENERIQRLAQEEKERKARLAKEEAERQERLAAEENERKEQEQQRLIQQQQKAVAVKKKCGQYTQKCDDIIDAINRNNFDEKKSGELNEIDINSFETMINEGIQKINGALSQIDTAIADCKHLSEEEMKKETYETEEELNETLEKIDQAQQMLSKYKKELHERNKQLQDKEMKILQQKQKENEKQQKLMEENNKLDETQVKVDALREELKNLSGDEVNADSGSVEKMNVNLKKLIKELDLKYMENKTAKAEVKASKERLRKIIGKLKAAKSQNKYMIELLDKEYDLLDKIADDAQQKYDNNTKYFLTIEMGLDENIIDLFIDADYDLEEIKDIDDEALIDDIGIEDEKVRKKILRKLKKINK